MYRLRGYLYLRSCMVCVYSEHVFTISWPSSLVLSRWHKRIGLKYGKIEASFKLVYVCRWFKFEGRKIIVLYIQLVDFGAL